MTLLKTYSFPTLGLNSEIGQGQGKVIIYINFVELESRMLNAKCQVQRTSYSIGDVDFKGFYHILA